MYEAQLQQLGLTEGESKVYEALLTLGSSTVGPVVKKSGVAYSNIYEILNRLAEKGFVSFIIKEKTKYFQAVEPTRIRDFLEKQELSLQKNKETFEKLLPNLESLTSLVGKKEEVEIFIGEKGLRTAYELLLKDRHKNEAGVFLYVHDPIYYENSLEFYKKLWVLLGKLSSTWRGISNEEYRPTEMAKKSPSYMEMRYVSFPLPINVDIFKDKLLIISWNEKSKPIGILIKSQEIADNFRRYFESVWSIAKP